MTNIAYIAASLDGYIADKNGGVDWLNAIPNPDQSDHGFAAFVQRVDALLMGANTFRTVQGFGVWPYDRPVFVASNSITEVPEGYKDRIALVRGDIREIIAEIQASGYETLYVDGGTLIQSCLGAGLLDELIITRIPIILGGGIPLFAASDKMISLEHKQTEVLGIGLVQSRYTVLNG